MKPRSKFIPSTTSSSFWTVFPSWIVIVPSFPTFSKAAAISSPIAMSPLAEIVATFLMLLRSLMLMDRFFRSATTVSTAFKMPLRMPTALTPAATDLTPSEKMARASTVAVVVPSPAMSLVFCATCLTSCAPMLWYLLANSISLATVTPSLVIFGPP